MDLRVIYEDTDIVAIDKPSGLLVHPHLKSTERTLSDWVLEKYPETANVGEPLQLPNGTIIKRPGIVHRLDKETSGVILIAKTQEAFELLKKQFQEKEIKKIYRAFVWGSFKELSGVIDKPIGRSSSDFRKKSAEHGKLGLEREAVTEYSVLKQNGVNAYLDVRPLTGRTHQIRVHLKSISRPVICDTLYAPKQPPALGFERLALHALSVTFKNMKGEVVVAEAPLSDDFERAERLLER